MNILNYSLSIFFVCCYNFSHKFRSDGLKNWWCNLHLLSQNIAIYPIFIIISISSNSSSTTTIIGFCVKAFFLALSSTHVLWCNTLVGFSYCRSNIILPIANKYVLSLNIYMHYHHINPNWFIYSLTHSLIFFFFFFCLAAFVGLSMAFFLSSSFSIKNSLHIILLFILFLFFNGMHAKLNSYKLTFWSILIRD